MILSVRISDQLAAAGILLHEFDTDKLHVRLISTPDGASDELSVIWPYLEQDLTNRARLSGAKQVVDWLRNSASHAIEVGPPREVQFRAPEEAVEELFAEYVHKR